MRDLHDYQLQYERLPFEAVQARYRKRKIIEQLAKYGARRILEIGCGSDPLFRYHGDFDRMIVVEPAVAFAEKARGLAAQDRRSVTVLLGAVEDLSRELAEQDFDFIVASSLLHEVLDPDALLRAIYPLCGPTTILHVNVPNANSFHRLLAKEMGLIGDVHQLSGTQGIMQQARTFDWNSLHDLIRNNGFALVEGASFFMKPFTHAQMAQLQEIGIASEGVLEGLYKLGEHFPENGSEIYMNVRAVT